MDTFGVDGGAPGMPWSLVARGAVARASDMGRRKGKGGVRP
jgi:hypothetical protein